MSDLLILGHTGFLGRNLMRSFPGAVGLSTKEANLLRPEEAELRSGEAVDMIASHCSPNTTLIMCAGIQKWKQDDNLAALQNCRMVNTVLIALGSKPIRQLVYVSSAAVYGEGTSRVAIREEDGYSPSTYYGKGKATCETDLLTHTHPESTLTIVRPTLVYGPDSPVEFYLPTGFVHKAVRDEAIPVWGDGSELRDFLYIDDFCAMVRRLVERRLPGAFTLGCERSISYRHVLDLIGDACGHPLRIQERPRTLRKVDLGYSLGRLRTAVGAYACRPIEAVLPTLMEACRQTKADVC